jgi:hypothetical protein
LFDQPLIAAAEDFLEKAGDHRLLSPARNRVHPRDAGCSGGRARNG